MSNQANGLAGPLPLPRGKLFANAAVTKRLARAVASKVPRPSASPTVMAAAVMQPVPWPFVVGTLPEMLEQEPNNGLDQVQESQLPVTINGRLERSGDIDVYAVRLQKGETLVASLEANRILASPMDGVLQICDDAGFVIEQNDDCRGLDPQMAFTAPRDGAYRLRVFAFPSTPNSTIRFAGPPRAAAVSRCTRGMTNAASGLDAASPGRVPGSRWSVCPCVASTAVTPSICSGASGTGISTRSTSWPSRVTAPTGGCRCARAPTC